MGEFEGSFTVGETRQVRSVNDTTPQPGVDYYVGLLPNQSSFYDSGYDNRHYAGYCTKNLDFHSNYYTGRKKLHENTANVQVIFPYDNSNPGFASKDEVKLYVVEEDE